MKFNTGDPNKYVGLVMADSTRDLLLRHPARFKGYCNGVGSKVSWWKRVLWHITPNGIYWLDITDCSDIHDAENSEPKRFATEAEAKKFFEETNLRFLRNLRKRITEAGGWLEGWRLNRAKLYYKAVSSEAGWQSFLADRIIG